MYRLFTVSTGLMSCASLRVVDVLSESAEVEKKGMGVAVTNL